MTTTPTRVAWVKVAMSPDRTNLSALSAAAVFAAGCYQVDAAPYDETSATTPPFDAPSEETETPSRPIQPPVRCDVQPTAACVASFPRVMIVMDASSSMLAGRAPGENNWDKARIALAGNPLAPNPGDDGYVRPAFARELDVRGNLVTMEDVFHLGMMIFNAQDTQALLLQYTACATDNVQWAMDPDVSCEPPGCTDPYSDSPEWTYKISDIDRIPPFVQTTMSYMPPCNEGGPEPCIGNFYNTYTAEGLRFAHTNIDAYRRHASNGRLSTSTRFANILITDGDTAPDSSPIDVLRRMAAEGILTYVIGLQGRGFGRDVQRTLETLGRYASAGGTGRATLIAANDVDIAEAFAATVTRIIDEIGTDPCCQPNDCSREPEPIAP